MSVSACVSVCERGNIGLAWLSLPLSTQPNDKSIFTLCDDIKYQADRKNANTRSPIFFCGCSVGSMKSIHTLTPISIFYWDLFIHPFRSIICFCLCAPTNWTHQLFHSSEPIYRERERDRDEIDDRIILSENPLNQKFEWLIADMGILLILWKCGNYLHLKWWGDTSNSIGDYNSSLLTMVMMNAMKRGRVQKKRARAHTQHSNQMAYHINTIYCT